MSWLNCEECKKTENKTLCLKCKSIYEKEPPLTTINWQKKKTQDMR